MKTLDDLTSGTDSAIRLVREWVAAADVHIDVLPPSDQRGHVLSALQVSTQSVLGAVAYETGGILVDHGWVRLLGSGHPRLTRTLPSWNMGRSDGFYLVADDAVGGFYALNSGTLGDDLRRMYYFAPDRLVWEPLELEFSSFVHWCMSSRVGKYYENVRWPSWREDLAKLHGDQCFFTYPPLWTAGATAATGHRGIVPVAESWGVQMDFVRQLNQPPANDE